MLLNLIYLTIINCVAGGWIDPDTSYSFYRTDPLTHSDNQDYYLVFSDEFNVDNRTFVDGEDPKWTAIDKNDYTNDALHYYRAENAKTSNGKLHITTDLKENLYKAFNEKTKKYYADTKHVQSAMLQGWNKFCMTGGIVEISAKLPGKPRTGGLWPALWLLGNLARASYVGSSNWVWPYSYDKCNEAVHFNQELNACRKDGMYGLAPNVGRGAPEIDILEAMMGEAGPLPNTPIERPYFSSSLQIAPGVKKNRPKLMHQPKEGQWYEGLEYGKETNTSLNPFFYGVTLVHKPKKYTYQSDAISANTHIGEAFFTKQQIYRVEWEPPEMDGTGGYIKWYVNGKFLFGVNGKSLNDLTGAEIPSEPMYLLLNTAVASSWGFPIPCPEGCDCACFDCNNSDCTCGLPTGFCENFPAIFEIDYVRVWQATDNPKHEVGCSTKNRPTDLFIKGHKERYMGEYDKEPLKPVPTGRGECKNDEQCGGSKLGVCSSKGFCKCTEFFTGPHCLAQVGFDDHPYQSQVQSIPFHEFRMPTTLMMVLSLLLIYLVAMLGYNVVQIRKQRYDSVQQNLIMKDIQKQKFLYHRAASFGFPTYGSLGDSNHSYKENGHDLIETREPVFHQPRLPEGVRSYVLIDEDLLP